MRPLTNRALVDANGTTDRGAAQASLLAASLPILLVVVMVMLIVMAVGAVFSDDAEACTEPAQPTASPGALNSIPAAYLRLYRKAGSQYSIPWSVLAGVGKVETDHGRSTLPGVQSGENYAGAGGPMQFISPTWDLYGIDGNKDAKTDRYDPEDAIPGAANYLRASGAPDDMRKALYAYNHSWQYVDLVSSWARKYGSGAITVDGGGTAWMPCKLSGDVGDGGPTGQRIVSYAMKWLKTPYLWGGGTWEGPTGHACSYGRCGRGFDCSGLTMYAVAQATGMKIKIGHYTGTQIADRRGQRIDFDHLEAGDLVFFTHPGDRDPHHVGIYIGRGQMVHAPHTGDWVKVSTITGGTYRSEFAGGRRFGGTQ